LFGTSLLYLAFGTTKVFDIVLLSYGLEPTLFVTLGLVFLVGALLFKLAAFPFHVWVVDVYSGVTLSVLLVLVVLPKLSVWGVFVFQLHHLLDISSFFEYAALPLAFFGLSGVIFGSLGAVFQQDFKKFIAYSSISNMGYVVLIFSTGLASSLYVVLYYIFVYSFLLLNLFALVYVVSFISEEQGMYLSIPNVLAFFFRTHKLYGFLFSLLLFSMAGVPPLMGFFPKFYVISGLWESGNFVFAILTALTTVLSAAYYSVFFVRLYFSKDYLPSYIVKDSPVLTLFVVLALINILYILFQDFVSLVVWLVTFFIL
jgi:NADH-quinone oxidoreductase subunit N